MPAGVTSIEVDALGAAGAGRQKGYIGIPGHGGRVKATIPVKPGQTLRIFVGGSGSYPSRGFNGGGDGAYRGGGATDVRDGDDLSDRILVAGGGGGVGPALGGGGTDGGGGGGKKGGNGHGGAFSGGIGSPGQGGTQSKGGAGGASGSKKAGAGSSGALGVGGNGGEGHSTRYVSESGSGGGGGYYGGGGGGGSGPLGDGGAGGGGSGYVEPTATDVHMLAQLGESERRRARRVEVAMNKLCFSRYAFSRCVAAALLAACGGSQPPIRAPGAMPQTSAIAAHPERDKSWMRSRTSRGDLIYVAAAGKSYVLAYRRVSLGRDD